MRKPGPPITVTDLHEVEQRLALRLPKAYRDLLLTCNGGEPMAAWFRHGGREDDVAQVTRLDSLAEMAEQTRLLRDLQVPLPFIGIGSVNDDFLLLDQDQGGVFWSRDPDRVDAADFFRVACSLDEFLACLDYLDGTKPQFPLIDNDDLDGLRHYLDNGGSTETDEVICMETAIERAAGLGRREMVQLLLAHGAEPGAALLYAIDGRHLELALYLANLGVSRPVAESAALNEWVRQQPELLAALPVAPVKIPAMKPAKKKPWWKFW